MRLVRLALPDGVAGGADAALAVAADALAADRDVPADRHGPRSGGGRMSEVRLQILSNSLIEYLSGGEFFEICENR